MLRKYLMFVIKEDSAIPHPGKHKIPDHLRREEIILEPDYIPEGSKKIGQAETEVLEYKPAELYFLKFIRPKYLLLEVDDTKSDIIIGGLPSLPIPKSMAGAGLLAQLVIEKFVDHIPLHRQMQRFERNGFKLPYSTLSDWMTTAAKIIAPLYEALVKETLSCKYLQADETVIPVLDKDKKGSTHRGYYWLYQDNINKLIIFDYQEGRSKEGPSFILKNFTGTLQTDGYAGCAT